MLHQYEKAIVSINSDQDVSCEFFEDLVVTDEGEEEIYVGRTLLNRFILVPRIAGEIIREIKSGKSIAQVSSLLDKNKIEVDLKDFLTNLIHLNFIKRVGTIDLPSEEIPKSEGITFRFIKQKYVKWIFTIPTGIAYLIFVSVSLFLLISGRTGSPIPTFDEVFWSKSLLKVVLSLIILDVIFSSCHELFHFLSIKAISGGLGFMSLGRRLTHLVFQTKIENIWVIPRKKRYIIYLSGMLFDLFLISIFTYVAYFQVGEQNLIYHLSRFLILLLIMGMIFEFRFYMKTDLYYVISDLLKYPTLFEESLEIVKSMLTFSRIKGNYLKKVWVYSLFMFLGSIIDIWITIKYFIPSVLSVYSNITDSFVSGNTGEIIANILTISLIGVEALFVIYFFLRDKYKQKKQRLVNLK